MPLTIFATPETSPDGVPRVRLNIAGGVGSTASVYRVDTDTGTRTKVRQGSPALLSAGAAQIYDYEAPFDQTAYYSATNLSTTSTSNSVIPTSAGPWLVHPGSPERSVPLSVLQWPTWKHPVTRGVFQPLNRPRRVAVSSRRQSKEGTLALYTSGAGARDAMASVLADGVARLIKGTTVEGAGTFWVSVGDVEEAPAEVDLREFVLWTLPLVEVDSPEGIALAAVTYADASTEFFSYQQATIVAPTYAARSGGDWKD